MNIQHKIGTQFIRARPKGHRKDLETVIDVHITTSHLTGEVVKIRYACSHDFLGQSIVDYDVNAVTIARGIVQ